MATPFLQARWSNLALLNFAVPDELLRPRLPPDLTLDYFDGAAYVSLVAFDFTQTRVKGVRWPGHVDFPEINLRFYVRCGAERGVVFIREYVPRRMISLIARHLYDEPYACAPMRSRVDRFDGGLRVEHELEVGGRTNRVVVEGVDPPLMAPPDSLEAHFKEHRWGFGVDRAGNPTYYEVDHPPWFCYRVAECRLDWDWGAVYGPEWAVLDGREPDSVVLAVGSEISVFPRATLE